MPELDGVGIEVRDAAEQEEVVQVGSGGLEQGQDALLRMFVRSQEQDVAWLARGVIGERMSAGEASGELEREQGDGSRRDVVLPEPVTCFGGHVGKTSG